MKTICEKCKRIIAEVSFELDPDGFTQINSTCTKCETTQVEFEG